MSSSGHKALLAPTQVGKQRGEAGGCGLISLLVVMLGCVIVGLVYNSDIVLPGVDVLGIELGWKSEARAREALQEFWRERTVLLEGTAAVRAESLGIGLDAKKTARDAHKLGRSADRLAALLRGEGGVSVPPVVTVDPVTAERNLGALAEALLILPTDASYRIAGQRVEAVPAIAGRMIDVPTTVAWLQRNADAVVEEGRLTLFFAAVQPAVTDLGQLVEAANQWLSTPMAVRLYDPVSDETVNWAISPAEWNRWLELREDPGAPNGLGWTFLPGEAQSFLTARAAELAPTQYVHVANLVEGLEQAFSRSTWAVSARIYHYGSQHVVQLGETVSSISRDYGMPYPWIQRENPGVGDQLRVGQVLNIPSPDIFLKLPVVENKRIVVSISQQMMWAYEGGAVKWAWPVSTGIASSPTSPGVFQIQSHEENAYAGSWDLWMPYFMGIYYPAPDTTVMNGFHGFPTRGGATLLWTGSLGYPVTYGCILVSTSNAALLYDWAAVGVVVEIRP